MDTQNALSPSHPIIFFDGYCGLCNHFIDWVIRRDSGHRMRYASLQGVTAQHMIRQLETSVPDSIILWQEGQHLVRSAAVAAVLKSLGGPWRRIGSVIELIPTALADRGYDLIARNRYRWFGKKDRCRLPSSAERHLFLE